MQTHREHLISLVQDKHFDGIGFEESTLYHILNTSRSTDNDLRAILKGFHVISNACSSDTSVTFDIHKIANGHDNLLDLLS